MSIIDFRARPATAEYMRPYTGPASEPLWRRFGHPQPPIGPLSDFADALRSAGVSRALVTGRQTVVNGEVVRGVTNDYVAECVAAYPELLAGFAGIDPLTRPAAVLAEIRRSIDDLGLRGASLDPHTARVLADDRLLYPLYAELEQRGLPVVMTNGPLVGPYGDLVAIDTVAADFPALTIVISHGCWPNPTEFVGLAYRRANVVLEASIYHLLPGAEPFLEAARTFLQDRVVYASAFPFNPLDSHRRLQALGFEGEVLEKVLFRNAARILGL